MALLELMGEASQVLRRVAIQRPDCSEQWAGMERGNPAMANTALTGLCKTSMPHEGRGGH